MSIAFVVSVLIIGIAVIAGVPALRLALISRRIFNLYKKILPPMSSTEQDALEAGTIWWEADLFRGKPQWSKLHGLPKPALT
ncbi:MAG: hypothetical protein B7X10_05420, partial [Burkholderiales bacterium 21-58-4]